MYVCICHAVTDKQIRRAAQEDGIETLDDLGDVLGVATCCGSCAPDACALLDEERDRARASADDCAAA